MSSEPRYPVRWWEAPESTSEVLSLVRRDLRAYARACHCSMCSAGGCAAVLLRVSLGHSRSYVEQPWVPQVILGIVIFARQAEFATNQAGQERVPVRVILGALLFSVNHLCNICALTSGSRAFVLISRLHRCSSLPVLVCDCVLMVQHAIRLCQLCLVSDSPLKLAHRVFRLHVQAGF